MNRYVISLQAIKISLLCEIIIVTRNEICFSCMIFLCIQFNIYGEC